MKFCLSSLHQHVLLVWQINYSKGVDMQKLSLLVVFLCGIIFASFLSVIKTGIQNLTITHTTNRLGVLSSNIELGLVDDGYVAMALVGVQHEMQSVPSNKLTDLEDKGLELEAINSLKAAVELTAAGKRSRAGRLLEHAHSLSPNNPDVLCTYAEFLEGHRNDIVQADHFYLKTLIISPFHSCAIRNRRRTLNQVDKIDKTHLSRIDDKRDVLAGIPSSNSPLRRIQKEAYFHHIYHTAGIEGNTLTLAQTRSILETGYAVGGKSMVEQNEVLGLDLALQYINSTLVHRVGPITMADVLQIHKRILGHSDPLSAGVFRTTQVYVSNHVPPAPTELEELLEDFISWLNSADALHFHPIKYAALAHYKLVFLHPFVDGNGRTARLLMNFLLMQAGYPPVIIRKQDRTAYYNHLQTANDGDTRPFIRFIAHCTEKILDLYLWATKEHLNEIAQDDQPSVVTSGDDTADEGYESSDSHLWLIANERDLPVRNEKRRARVLDESRTRDAIFE